VIVPDKLSALVVDDNAYARAAATATLRKLGLTNIVEADGGAPAVGSLLASRFDIVLLDWYMPEMSGAALLQVMRDPRFGANGTVPVIMMTAYPNRETITRGRQLGCSEVLTKPFTAAQVSSVLGRLLPHGWDLPSDAASGDVAAKIFL